MSNVIIVGAGHAGIEAALACAKKGINTTVITGNIEMIGNMPCNPSIGGPAKGIVVREIDALGGIMGENIDHTMIQIRMLNHSRGPAVRALRAQADKILYPKRLKEIILEKCNVIEEYVDDLIIENSKCIGVVLESGKKVLADKVIVTTGTYMQSNILVGTSSISEGPDNEKVSKNLSENLRKLGFETLRLKTGTPPRIKKDSINYDLCEEHKGDFNPKYFSFDSKHEFKSEEQLSCYLTYTTDETKKLIEDNLVKSPMYSGQERGAGPRYCPSIEDKIVRFNDKERHQVFLEPESRFLEDIYVQGFSTSMPIEIQDKMLRTITGLKDCEVIRYAYAIEYDAINPTQLFPTLESKLINNLYFAGQVNGTSGYEEAACQGLMAGINASLSIEGKKPFVLRRDEAYIGVLIDDLVTKGTKEPYRLLTSRAEFRLLLRHDNADIRLRDYGYNLGLINESVYEEFINKKTYIKEETKKLSETFITSKQNINDYLLKIGSTRLKDRISLLDLLKRTEIGYIHLYELLNEELKYNKEVYEQIEINTKYKGYIQKMIKEAEKLKKLENKKIPNDINYLNIENLALEARDKLTKVKPLTIGQASRISGVNPADISILLIYLESRR